MQPSLTDRLCTQCGLCCDGSLFADVELSGPAEATRLELLGLNLGDDGGSELLELPCAALEGTRCSIYALRPKCCRTFECRLLGDVRAGRVTEERALLHIAGAFDQIGQVKALLSQLGDRSHALPLRERCAEVLAAEVHGAQEEESVRIRLEAAMTAVDEAIRRTFLGGRKKRGAAKQG
jgi:uncharacterized protein